MGDPRAIDVSRSQRSYFELRGDEKEGELEGRVRRRHLQEDTAPSPPHYRLDSMLAAESRVVVK